MGPDLVNFGRHGAVDAGNAAKGYPVRAPAGCMMRPARHFDDARGREFDLGGDWLLSLWHLAADAATDALPAPGLGTSYGAWARVARGATVARTGDTGARLPTGAPMPAHTHIELRYQGAKVDPEPYLFGQAMEGAYDMDDQHFDDVAPGDPFYDDIQWMYEAGLSDGVGDTNDYVPDGLVTRGQLAAFLHRFERHIRAGA
jgi:hypothetical protein